MAATASASASAAAVARGPGLSLSELRARTAPQALAAGRSLPVTPGLAGLFASGGLPVGEVVQVDSPALAAALLVAATRAGSWAAVVGQPDFGLAAAAQMGVVLGRLAVVRVDDAAQMPMVVAALVDALDVVVLGDTVMLSPVMVRRITARARERGAVLLVLGAWADTPGLRLTVVENEWCGLGDGHGHLHGRRVVLRAEGRRGAARPRTTEVWLQGGPSLWADDLSSVVSDVVVSDVVVAPDVVAPTVVVATVVVVPAVVVPAVVALSAAG